MMVQIITITILTFSLLSCTAQPPKENVAQPTAAEGPPVRKPDQQLNTDASAPSPTVVSGKPMLLEFTRDHCLPCTIMAPWMAELKKQYSEQVDINEINIDRPGNKELGIYFKVASIPTQVYVNGGGKVLSRHVGLATSAQMEATLRKHGFLDNKKNE